MGTIACLIMFAMGTAFGGRWAGAGTALLIAWNPLFRTLSRRAMRDVPAECLILLSVGIALWMWPKLFTKNGDWKKWVVFSVLEGIVIGLAAMTRLTGISAWVMVFLILVLASICWLYTRFKKEEGTDSSENLWGRLPSGLFAICTRLGIFVVLSLQYVGWLIRICMRRCVLKSLSARRSVTKKKQWYQSVLPWDILVDWRRCSSFVYSGVGKVWKVIDLIDLSLGVSGHFTSE